MRMSPANEGLHPGDLSSPEVRLGLIVEDQLIPVDRLTKLGHQGQADSCALVVGRHVDRILAVVLPGRCHGDVRSAQKVLSVGAVLRVQADAEASRDTDWLAVHKEAALQATKKMLGESNGGSPVPAGRDDGKLIAFETGQAPTDGVSRFAQASRDLLQERVGKSVAEGVVDLPELVQVDDQQAEPLVRNLLARDRLLEIFAQPRPIWEAGQRIVMGAMLERAARAFPVRHVDGHADHSGDGTCLVPERSEMRVKEDSGKLDRCRDLLPGDGPSMVGEEVRTV